MNVPQPPGGWQPDRPYVAPGAEAPINPDVTTKLPFDPRLLDPSRSGPAAAVEPGYPQAQPQPLQQPGGYPQSQFQQQFGQPPFQQPAQFQQAQLQQAQYQPQPQFQPQAAYQPLPQPRADPPGAAAGQRWWPAVNTLVWLLATGLAIGALLALA
jgi:serine/threonine protein kinase, bacterial